MKTVIITAGGIGSRMQSDVPKQFLVVDDQPVLMQTLHRFYSFDPTIQIVLTLPSDWISFWKELLEKYQFDIPHQIVEGGKERFDSIKNALRIVQGNLIGVHDGVRPFVSQKTISECYSTAEKVGAAIPYLPIHESMRQILGDASVSINRAEFVTVQTPQCFKREILLNAYEQSFKDSFTDDASVVESNGGKISLVLGNQENIKITTPNDIKIAKLFVKDFRNSEII
jgi:2-C-methyl-D-erythritol 4-phosphate cytidylyltransferase